MGKKSFLRNRWIASTAMLAAGALAVYGVWQIPSLNDYHMESLQTPISDELGTNQLQQGQADMNAAQGNDSSMTEGESLAQQPAETSPEENAENITVDQETAENVPEQNLNSVDSNEGQAAQASSNTDTPISAVHEGEEIPAESVSDSKKNKNKNKDKKSQKGAEKKDNQENSVAVLSNPESALNETNFDESAGLSWPVQGDVILNYDTEGVVYFQTLCQYRANPAIVIASKEGSKVKAASAGVVNEIAQSDETGTMVVVSAGNGYELVYGQLTDLKVKEGDTIEEGAVIGKIGEPTDYFAVEGANLYFQILQNDEPVNPLLLLK